MKRLLLPVLLSSHLLCIQPGVAQEDLPIPGQESPMQPRQVILFIGDGMDEQQITIARNYLKGASGQLLLDSLPLRAAVQVLSTEDRVDGAPIYVADSANTASAMASGAVTSRGRISTSAGSDDDLTTIIELAAAAGLRAGLVTTASVTDATVAAFAAHISSRLCENPDRMVDVTYYGVPLADCSQDLKANGGPGSISEQLAVAPLHVLLGGGGKHFQPTAEGQTYSVEELAQKKGFKVVTSTPELLQATPPGKLLGLFSPGTMPVRLQGEDGREAEAPETSWLSYIPFIGSDNVTLPEPMTCERNPEAAAIPTLQQMTDVALDLLSHENDKGFFLMVESASIDKQAHERKPCGSIGEVAQLEEALASALAFAREHPHTLVIVTSDHAQSAQLVPYTSLFERYPVAIYSPGKIARILTPEGGRMTVNYATNSFVQEEHTGAAVPLFSNDEGLGRIPPYLQQPQLFQIMRDYLAL